MDPVNFSAHALKEIAEQRIIDKDYTGARDMILRAQQISPDFESFSQMCMICDIICAAELEFPGYGTDWYWVLQLYPSADSSDVISQYQKLSAIVEPMLDKFKGAESATKLIREAFLMLSDPTTRSVFDSKRTASRKGNMLLNSGSSIGSEMTNAQENVTRINCCPPTAYMGKTLGVNEVYGESSSSVLVPELQVAYKIPDYVKHIIQTIMSEVLSKLAKCTLTQLVQFKEQELDCILPFMWQIATGFESLSKFLIDFEKQVDSLTLFAHSWEQAKEALSKTEEQLTLIKQAEDSIAVYEAKHSLMSTRVKLLYSYLDMERSRRDMAGEEVKKLDAEVAVKRSALQSFSTKCKDLEVALAKQRKYLWEVDKQIDLLVFSAGSWKGSKVILSNMEEQYLRKQAKEFIAVYERKHSLMSTMVTNLSKDLDRERCRCDSVKVEVHKLQAELAVKELALCSYSNWCADLEVSFASHRKHLEEVETAMKEALDERERLRAGCRDGAAAISMQRKCLEDLMTYIIRAGFGRAKLVIESDSSNAIKWARGVKRLHGD